jgi:hypothetical protein
VRLRDRFEPALEVPNPVLADIYATSSVIDDAGSPVQLRGNISVAHANALYRTVRSLDPTAVIEVGMAFGIATLAIASALHDAANGGQLISIDPHQSRHWRRVTRFVTTHRRYREIDVGLRRRYASRDVPTTIRRLATLRSKSDRYFRKLETWEPPSDFYARF